MSEHQLQKPGRNNKLTLAIIAGAVIALAVGAFFVFAGKHETTDYSLIPVSNDGERWGYINLKGEYVINPQFGNADYFNDGLAKITSVDGKTGYINKKGEYVIPATYKSGTVFNNGLAFVVAEGGFPTCIDKNGNTKFVLNAAKYVSAFSEGMAMFVTETGECGFVDGSGNIAINAQFDRALPFSGNYARVWQNGDGGFIDKKGSIIINPQFSEVGNFSEGKAAFNNGNSWGYIDQKGTYVVNPMFDDAGCFCEGLAAIRQGRSYGYIDKDGKLAINPQFDNASPFSGGLAVVRGSGKYGYINKDGKYEINPQFEDARDFHDGIAMVRSGDKWGFINKKGQYVANPQFKYVKLEVSPDVRPDLIENDYYDTSEFIRLFFEKEAGNTFDGIGASTTLEQLSEHPVYGAGLNASTSNNADYRQRIPVTNDIFISGVTLIFENTPIYEYVNEGYHRTQKWNFDATPDAIVYKFDLNGKAREKRHVVVNALKSEIERRYGQAMKSDGDHYYLSHDNGKLGFTISGNEFRVVFRDVNSH